VLSILFIVLQSSVDKLDLNMCNSYTFDNLGVVLLFLFVIVGVLFFNQNMYRECYSVHEIHVYRSFSSLQHFFAIMYKNLSTIKCSR